MSDSERDAFLGEQMVMQCATVGPRGLPHLVPLWFVNKGTELRGWTYAKSQKAKNLSAIRGRRSESRTGSSTTSCAESCSSATCTWRATRPRLRSTDWRSLARYAGALGPEVREMVAQQAQKRVGLTFVPFREVTWDHRKLGGAY